MDRNFTENGFIIDLSNAKTAAQIIYELSSILDMPETNSKDICLKVGAIDLNRSQLLSIKSLILSMDNDLAFIDTTSAATESSAVNLGIIISELKNEIEIPSFAPAEDHFAEVEEEEVYSSEEPEVTYVQMDVKDLNLKHANQADDGTDFDEDADGAPLPTLYLEETMRCGQTITYDGNIIIIGDVHPGSEVIARGDITVWGVLGGIAHAGARGDKDAKIRALKMNAIQLRIAGLYARRPDTMNIPFIQKTDTFTPETAKVINGKIVTYKFEN